MKKILFALLLTSSVLSLVNANAQVFSMAVNVAPNITANAPDGFGNSYVAGKFNGTVTISGTSATSAGDYDAWLAKYDAAGSLIWLKTGGDVNADRVDRILVDNTGNVYVFVEFSGTTTWNGSSYTSAGSSDMLVVKYNGAGDVLWVQSFGSTGAESDWNTFMDLDNYGNLHICSYYAASSITVGGSSYTIGGLGHNMARIKLDGSTGSVLQVQGLGNQNSGGTTSVATMHVDGEGNVYSKMFSTTAITIGGTSVATTISLNQVLSKQYADGTMAWYKTLDYYSGPNECIRTDAMGNVTFTGDYDSHFISPDTTYTMTGIITDDLFIVHYDSSGNLKWAKFYGSTAGYETAHFCMVDPAGSITVVGHCEGAMDVDGLTLSPIGRDLYVIDLDENGTVSSAMCSHTPGDEYIYSAAKDNNNNISIGGFTTISTNFGPYIMSTIGVPYYSVVLNDNACQAHGRVYNDFNSSGTIDGIDNGIKDVVVETDAGDYYALTGSSGAYQLFTLPGTYTLSIPYPPLYHTATTPLTQTATFSALGVWDTANHFGFYPTPGIRDLRVFATSIFPPKPGHLFSVGITYKNVGTDTTDGTVSLGYPGTVTFFSSNPATSWSGTDSLQWSFTGMVPGETRTIQVWLSVSTSVVEGDMIDMPITIASGATDATPSDNFLLHSSTVISSYDPNTKEVSPSAVIPAYVTTDHGWFYYTIRFQNTGSDTAFNIVVRDTLDAQLDIPSFELIGYSHPMTMNMQNPRLLQFNFNNINLPDSNVNEAASHGMVSFRIKAKDDMTIPGQIFNKSAIYFDYNVPVITNTAIITVGDLGIGSAAMSNTGWQLAPNPASGSILIQVMEGKASDVFSTLIADVSGRIQRSQSLSKGAETTISLDGLSNGIYFVSLVKNGTIVGMKKLVIAK